MLFNDGGTDECITFLLLAPLETQTHFVNPPSQLPICLLQVTFVNLFEKVFFVRLVLQQFADFVKFLFLVDRQLFSINLLLHHLVHFFLHLFYLFIDFKPC